MIEYASVLLNRCSVGRDGLTAYRRVRGKRCSKPTAEFGEKLLWRRKKKTDANKLANMESRWNAGIFLGIDNKSGELIMGANSGVYKTHAFHRVPVEDRWDYDMIMSVKGTPWNLKEDADTEDTAIRVDTAENPVRDPEPRITTNYKKDVCQAK